MRIGVAISSASAVQESWTTAALVAAAQRQGHEVFVIASRDWGVSDHAVVARAFRLEPGDSTPAEVASALQLRTAARARVSLGSLDLLLLRAAPLPATLVALAIQAEQLGVRVVNRPPGVVLASHKGWLASMNLGTPPTLVTGSLGEAHLFFDEAGEVVVKPNRGSGGKAVSRVEEGDTLELDRSFARARRAGDGLVVVQAYVPEADEGEKRLVWCDGEILGGYLRRRAPGEFRHNLKQGARPEVVEITSADRALGRRLQSPLLTVGIRLAGLDVIGDRLVEVNAVNPGGTVLADALHGSSLADRIIRQLTRMESQN